MNPTGICNKCKHEIEHGKCISCGALEAVNWMRAWDTIRIKDKGTGEITYVKPSKQSDNVNPKHYTDMVISPYEYVTANEMNWEQSNVVKYISRYKNKNQAEDIRKAIKYCEMLLEREYGTL